jgi:hypothetical protein
MSARFSAQKCTKLKVSSTAEPSDHFRAPFAVPNLFPAEPPPPPQRLSCNGVALLALESTTVNVLPFPGSLSTVTVPA